MDIILDTNIFRSDLFFQSAHFNILADYLQKTNSKFVLPQIVLEEVKQVFKENLEKSIIEYKSSCNNLNKSLHKSFAIIKEIDIDKEAEDYVNYLIKTLKIKENSIIPYKNEYLPELTRRAVNKIKPFKNEDKGFRDTIIWLTILDYCKLCPENQVVFICNNPLDFGKDNNSNELHPSLTEELLKLNIKVCYYRNTNEFIEKHSTNIDFITKEWLNEKISETQLSYSICEFINSINDYSILEWIEEKSKTGLTGYYNAIQTTFYELNDFFIYEMIDGSLIIKLVVEAEIEIEYEYSRLKDLMNNFSTKLLAHGSDYIYLTREFSVSLTCINKKIECYETSNFY